MIDAPGTLRAMSSIDFLPLRAVGALALLLAAAGCASHERPSASRSAASARKKPFATQPFMAPGAAVPQPPPVVKPPPALAVDDATRLQIFLDRENFGPGKLDGKSGEFTRKAVDRYGRANGKTLPAPGPALLAALPEARRIDPYTEYTLTADDAAQIGSIPDDRAAQGKLKSLPYTSALELVAERFHAERDFLRRLNPGRNLDALQAGDRLQVPNIAEPLYVNRLAQHGRFLPARPEFQPRVVHVDTREKMLDVIEDGRLLASFPITPGSTALPAPAGTWKLVNMASMPYFRYDEMMLNHGVRSENFVQLPPGPNSPVGVMWMGLNKSGIGLHGTNNPETIGRAASHGCIRLANWDAVKLSALLTPQVTVKID
jgi:lipoprotein-anchoring transpeptidase ErfK/SrfK